MTQAGRSRLVSSWRITPVGGVGYGLRRISGAPGSAGWRLGSGACSLCRIGQSFCWRMRFPGRRVGNFRISKSGFGRGCKPVNWMRRNSGIAGPFFIQDSFQVRGETWRPGVSTSFSTKVARNSPVTQISAHEEWRLTGSLDANRNVLLRIVVGADLQDDWLGTGWDHRNDCVDLQDTGHQSWSSSSIQDLSRLASYGQRDWGDRSWGIVDVRVKPLIPVMLAVRSRLAP